MLCFALGIVGSALLADRIGQRTMVAIGSALIAAFGCAFPALFGAHDTARALAFLCLGFGACGAAYGPLGSALARLFPTAVRYTGTSLSFNLSGILGASVAPYIAKSLGEHFGIASVGYYLTAIGVISTIAMSMTRAPTMRAIDP